MSHEHRCICATCSKEMKSGRDFSPAYPISKLSAKRHTSSVPTFNGASPETSRGWADWLLEWAKIALKFGYLLLAFFKL